jgi:hypothetical protein
MMRRIGLTLGVIGFLLALVFGVALTFAVLKQVSRVVKAQTTGDERTTIWRRPPQRNFQLTVLVDGRPLAQYYARGKTYIEALKGSEYELQITNPTPDRVAVALSVDGLNTIDARHTSAWNSSKWVIEPYQTITIGGWQMSTERARRFYFTSERDSYGAKLGQTANLGIISAVIFRERGRMITVNPPRPIYRDNREKSQRDESAAPSANSQSADSSRKSKGAIPPVPDDDYAATGIGRSVRNDVRWIDMELESQPAAELTIRYEYYAALLKLGVMPRPYNEPYPLGRREDSRGFSPEP